jgi:transglutaminase-like putative cysteine protease
MNRLVILAITFLITLVAAAGDGDYAVFKISPVLMKGANAVIRKQESRLEINSARNAVYKDHYVITILNENGDEWADFGEYYDKLRQVNSVEGYLYDMMGKQLKKMKYKDLEDLSGVSGSNLIDDDRIKHHNFYYKIYPYTVEYTVEIEFKSTLFFPMWSPQGKENLAVEHSTMSIVCPEDYKFRYKAFKYSGDPLVTKEKNNTVTTWEAKNMTAIIREPYAPMWHELSTVVIFGPTDFQVDDYKGNMTSWQDFGKFVYSLKKDRDQLPDNVKKTVHQLTDGLDTKEKIVRLYQYLQKNTRYISIQLGIGGWQPFDATYVATKAYGDCKALTNYMYSLLKEAGIPSCYTLIRAGSYAGYITDDFPSQQFNHVILCVPQQKDSIWLECTSQTLPAGYLSDFTCNRFALLVDENGGKLVRTPRYGIKENLENRIVKAVLQDNGTLSVKVNTNYGGLQQDELHQLINNVSKDKVKEYLHEQLDFATYDVLSFDYKENRSALPSIDESLDISVSNYATITGKRLFIIPNVMTRTHQKYNVDTSRKYDIVFNYEYQDLDTVEIELPKGYEAETIPKDVTVKSQFGKYNCSVKLAGNKLYYYRNIERFSGRFPAGSYDDLRQFYEAIYKSDRNRVVLVRNEQLKAF